MKKYKGIVKWFDKEKGYGFIQYKNKNIYVHKTQLVNSNSLVDGEYVEFEPVQTLQGYKAKNVVTSTIAL